MKPTYLPTYLPTWQKKIISLPGFPPKTVSSILRDSLRQLAPKETQRIVKFYDQFKKARDNKALERIYGEFSRYILSLKQDFVLISGLMRDALLLKHERSQVGGQGCFVNKKSLSSIYNKNNILEFFLPPLPRSQLVEVVDDLKVLANMHSKKTLPALFFKKGTDGEVVSEGSIFPEPRKFNFNQMSKLLGIKHKAQVDLGRLKVVDGRGSSGLKSLELALGTLKGAKEMTGVLLNHHNQVHWDGLLVVGDSVYIPTIVTTEHSFFKDIKAICERLGMNVYKGVQLQANDSTCGAIALKCVSYFLDANKVPDLLKEKIVLSPDLLVFAESTKMWEEGVKDWELLNGVKFPFDRPPKELFLHGNGEFKGAHAKIMSDFDSSLRVPYKGGVIFDASLREGYLAQCWLSEYYVGIIQSQG